MSIKATGVNATEIVFVSLKYHYYIVSHDLDLEIEGLHRVMKGYREPGFYVSLRNGMGSDN